MGVNWDRPHNPKWMHDDDSDGPARRRMIVLLLGSVCIVLLIVGVWLLLPTTPNTTPQTTSQIAPQSTPKITPKTGPAVSTSTPDLPLIAPPREQPQIQRPAPVAPEPEARAPAPPKPEPPPQLAIQPPAPPQPVLQQPVLQQPVLQQPEIAPREQQELQARVAVMIRQGDIAGARVILARLDRTGNRQATFTLAETYDPAMLAQWNVRGIKADPTKAAELYQRAIDGGVSAARARSRGRDDRGKRQGLSRSRRLATGVPPHHDDADGLCDPVAGSDVPFHGRSGGVEISASRRRFSGPPLGRRFRRPSPQLE